MHGSLAGEPLIRQRNPGCDWTIVVLATRRSTFRALPPEEAQVVEPLMATVTPLLVEHAAAWADGCATAVRPAPSPTVAATTAKVRRRPPREPAVDLTRAPLPGA